MYVPGQAAPVLGQPDLDVPTVSARELRDDEPQTFDEAAERVQPEPRGATVKCMSCGLEVTGVELVDGRIKASDRTRPALDAPVKQGLCMSCLGSHGGRA
jgi:hypothetical protein